MKAYLGAVAIAAVLSAGTAQAQSLGIGAGSQGSQNYAVNAGLGSFLTDKAGMDVRVQAFGGSGASMPPGQKGQPDAAASVGARCVLYTGGFTDPAKLRAYGVPVADTLLEAVALAA